MGLCRGAAHGLSGHRFTERLGHVIGAVLISAGFAIGLLSVAPA